VCLQHRLLLLVVSLDHPRVLEIPVLQALDHCLLRLSRANLICLLLSLADLVLPLLHLDAQRLALAFALLCSQQACEKVRVRGQPAPQWPTTARHPQQRPATHNNGRTLPPGRGGDKVTYECSVYT